MSKRIVEITKRDYANIMCCKNHSKKASVIENTPWLFFCVYHVVSLSCPTITDCFYGFGTWLYIVPLLAMLLAVVQLPSNPTREERHSYYVYKRSHNVGL